MAKLRTYLTANIEGWRHGFSMAEKSVTGLRRRMDNMKRNFGRSFATLGKMAMRFAKVGLVAAAAAIAGGLALSARNAIKFNERMAEVNTIANLSQEQLNVLGMQAMQLSRQLGQGTEETVKALYDSLSAGVPADNVIQFLSTAGVAAIAGVTSIDVAVDGLTSTLNAYGLNASYAGKASDLFFNIVKEGKITFPELAKNIGKVAPLAKAAGLSMETMSAAIATAVKVEKPERAMTQLAAAMREAAKRGMDFNSFVGQFDGKNLTQILGAGVSEEAARGIILLAGNYDLYLSQLEKARTAAGLSEEAYKKMAATPAQQIKQLSATLETVSIQLGNAFLPLINQAVQAINSMFGGLDTAEGQQKLISFATTAVLTMTGFGANVLKTFNNVKAYGVGSFLTLKNIFEGVIASMRAYFTGFLALWTFGFEKSINLMIAGLNKLPNVNIQPVSFSSGLAEQAKEEAAKAKEAFKAAFGGDSMAQEVAKAMTANATIDQKREQIESKITEQAQMQMNAAMTAAQKKKEEAAAEQTKTGEASKQLELQRQSMQMKFAAAVTDRSLEAYRAALPSRETMPEKDVAKNTEKSNKILSHIDENIGRLVGARPQAVAI